MPKLTLTDITSGYASVTQLNNNFAAIETAIENTVSRDGTTPNTMSADLDMNGHLILNQANPIAISNFEWNGNWVTATAYTVGDIVYESSTGTAYICVVAHTSGTFATDLADIKWQIFASAALPPQTTQATKFLQTNGGSASWEVPDSVEVSFTQSGTGAVATTVQEKLRTVLHPDDYDTNANYVAAAQAAATGQHFTQNGAIIQRLTDRVFVGGAIDNDGTFPNVSKDWLTTYQNTLKLKLIVGVASSGVTTSGSPIVTFTAGGITPTVGAFFVGKSGIPSGTTVVSVDSTTQVTLSANATSSTTGNTFYSTNGTAIGGTGLAATMFALTTTSPASASSVVFGAHSQYFNSAGASCLGLAGFAVNDNTTLSTSAWGGYFEAHRLNSVVGAARGIEIDVLSLAASEIAPNGFQQSLTSGLQIGAGCGVDATGQTNIGAAIQIVGNPMKFHAGIVFLNDSLAGTDGITGTGVALAMASRHGLEWRNIDQALAARVLCTNTVAADATEVRFAPGGLQILGASGQALLYVNSLASAVNYLTLVPATTTNGPYMAATGSDTNIDLRLITKGTGVLSFGTWTSNADAAVNGYVTIKDAAGTTRKLATIA